MEGILEYHKLSIIYEMFPWVWIHVRNPWIMISNLMCVFLVISWHVRTMESTDIQIHIICRDTHMRTGFSLHVCTVLVPGMGCPGKGSSFLKHKNRLGYCNDYLGSRQNDCLLHPIITTSNRNGFYCKNIIVGPFDLHSIEKAAGLFIWCVNLYFTQSSNGALCSKVDFFQNTKEPP